MNVRTAEILSGLAGAVADGALRTVDLTQTLSPETPVLVLPPEFGQCAPFTVQEISRYDSRGVAWYWNNFSMCEHTGTHFDAPVHWVTGKDLPANAVDTMLPEDFIAPAAVLDVSREAAENPDFLLSVDHIKSWEVRHGRIPPRHWILMRTDWSKRSVNDYVNRRGDGSNT